MGSVHSIERAAIRTLMLADLAKIMRNMPEGDKMQQRTWLTQAVFDLVAVHGASMTEVAVNQLYAARDANMTAGLPVILAEAAASEQVESAVGWALGMPDVVMALRGAVLRLGQRQSRLTVVKSAAAAGNGFARVCSPNACDFCAMLASRGAVYLSAESAEFVGTTRVRGPRKPGEQFHDWCKCEVVEVRGAGDLPALNQRLQELWDDSTKNLSGKKAQAAFSKARKNAGIEREFPHAIPLAA